MVKTPDELSRELSHNARTHPDRFWSFMLIDASVMIRELAGLPALEPAKPPPPPPAAEAAQPPPARQGRPKLQQPAAAPAAPSSRPKLRQQGGFFS
jgi:hypothetical protein